MKSQERHKLKENEFAKTVLHARDVLDSRRRDLIWGLIIVLALLASVGAYAGWRQMQDRPRDRAARVGARGLRGAGRAAAGARARQPGAGAAAGHVSIGAGQARGRAAEVPRSGRPLSEQRRRHCRALPRRQHPRHARPLPEAEQRYQEVLARAGSSLYGRTARLGLADAQVAQKKYDNAINDLHAN